MKKIAVRWLASLAVFLLSFSSYGAGEGSQGITIDGTLFGSTDFTNPLLDASVSFKIQILDPTKNCVLYEETQTVNTAATAGKYNLSVGSATGAAQRSGDDPNHAMIDIFQNVTNISATNAGCPGSVYSPSSGDGRFLRVTVTPSSTSVPETMSPDLALTSVSNALVCESVQGLDRDKLAEFGTHINAAMTAANLLKLFDGSDVASLHNHDAEYAKLSNSNSIELGTQQTIGFGEFTNAQETTLTGGLGAGDAGKTWYNSDTNTLMYWDGSSAQAIGSGGGGAITSVFGRTGVVTAAASDYDANQIDNTPAGNIAATDVQAAITELDNEKLALSGGTMSGIINMNDNNLDMGTGSAKIVDLADPTNAQDAATKAYVDSSITTNNGSFVAKAGDSMTGALAMGTNKVTGVGDPTSAQDAATKNYVDTKLIGQTLPSSPTAGQNGQALRWNNGSSVWEYYTPASGGLSDIVSDTTPQLGGTLDINGQNMSTAAGFNIDITGSSAGNDFTVDSDKLVVEGDTGNVGVGTATPLAQIHVDHSGSNTTAMRIGDQDAPANDTGVFLRSTGIAYIGTHSSQGDLRLMADTFGGSSEGITVKSSGNVGFGTTSPNETVTIEGGMSFKEMTAPTTDVATYHKLYVDSADDKLKFRDEGGTVFDLTSGVGSSTVSGLTDTTISSPSDNQVLAYDSGTSKWVNQSVNASAAKTMVSGWPDVIKCSDGTKERVLYNRGRNSGGTLQIYQMPNTSSFELSFVLATGAYSTHTNLSGLDCVTGTMSITELYAAGQAFNFVGGGLNTVSTTSANYSGAPDALVCTNGSEKLTLINSGVTSSGNHYRFYGPTATDRWISYAVSGGAYDAGDSSESAFMSGSDCSNASLSSLTSLGVAKYFGNDIKATADADGDTKVQVEKNTDEDIIRFDTAGTERMTIAADGSVNVVGSLTAGTLVGDASGVTNIGASAIADGSITVADVDFASSNGINIPQLASDPGSPTAGQMYYNTSTNKMMIYNGSSFVEVGSGSGGSGSASCPSGFTKIESAGRSLGCIETDEHGSGLTCKQAATACHAVGGRLPSYGEISLAFQNYTLSNESDDNEWLENGTYEGTSSCGVITPSGEPNIQFASDTDDAYRCFIPWGSIAGGVVITQDADNDTKIQVEESSDEDIIRFDTAGTERMVIDGSGNVGIGTSTPNASAKLDVDGAMVSRAHDASAATSFDWANGNVQYTTASCAAMTLSNMLDGGSYTLVVKGTTSGTCSFTHAGMTVKMPLGHGATDNGTHTIYSFLRAGTDIYVTWIKGY